MTHRFFSVLAGLLLSASVTHAQQDPKAGKILDEMSAKYKALKGFKANFQQTLENPSNKIKETIEGDIVVSGTKFRLQTKGQEVVNNGTTMWTYMKAENEVNVSDYDPDENEITPSQIFTLYQKGYKYTYVEQMTEAGIVYDVVELAPEDRSNSLIKVRLQVGKKDRSVKSWKMFKKNGNRYSFIIKKFTPNPPLTASTFTFEKAKYKGVKVIDLR
jgi:outer membrane lipoprotein carrier protein